jgi:RNA polymerase-binding protein DksA
MAVSYDKIKTRLEEQRDAIKAEIAALDAHPRDALGYSNHQADDGTAAFDQAADLAMRHNATRLLYDIERALDRLEKGTYGVCRKCGARIDPARLDAIPYTRYCMDCADGG